jgi:hypothetical protein
MSPRKGRLTVTVDRALIDAGNAAVASGQADSLSGWVNLALRERAARERRLQAMAAVIATYEAEFGVISPAELAAQARADRRSAIIPSGAKPPPKKARRRRAV